MLERSPRRVRARGRFRAHHAIVAVLALAWLIVGLVGTYSYAENYYLHRGFATPQRLRHADAGQLFTVHFHSRALGAMSDYLVYLPSHYSRARRYPVYYLLHGLPGRPVAYTVVGHIEVRLDNLISQGLAPPMILVFPDGRIGGDQFTDSEWANTATGRYDSLLLDVVHDVDHRFSTIPNRNRRVIAGLSAGAYGAINIALHHLPVFGSVQVWSGYFTQTRTGVFANATRAQLAYNSPIEYVRHLRRALRRYPLHAFLFVGRGDSASRQIAPMARALRSAGAAVRWAIYRGGHDWQVWAAHLNQMVILAGHDFRLPLARAPRRPGHHLRHAGRRHRHSVRPHRPRRPAHPARRHPARRRRRRQAAGAVSTGGLLTGLLLALLSAVAINVGFLLQHRGLARAGRVGTNALGVARRALRSRSWLGGQALGWAGFAAQITAVAIAPLSLVQAFAAGGLAFSVPLAARLFGHRLDPRQVRAVLLAAVGLGVLPIALPAGGDTVHTQALLSAVIASLVVALPLASLRSSSARAISAGLLYGVADAAIKAISVRWSAHGLGTLASGWGVLAGAGTFAGFLAFQAALRAGSAVTAISLMNIFAALVALVCGLAGFGESLGAGPAAVLMHGAAVALVLGCVPVLARAHHELSEDRPEETDLRRGTPAASTVSSRQPRDRPWKHRGDGEHQPLHPRTGAR